RKVSSTHGNDLRRVGDERCSGAEVPRPPLDDRSHSYLDSTAPRASGLPLLWSVCAWLHHTFLLQQPSFHFACGPSHRQAHAASIERGAQSYLRPKNTPH